MTDADFLDILARIRVTQGAKAKQAFLKLCESHKEYLRLAYDPFINFYITSDRFKDEFRYGREDRLPPAVYFEKIHTKQYSPKDVVEGLFQYAPDVTKRTIDFILMVFDKDLSLGLAAKSINKVFPGLISVFNIMLAERENKEAFDRHFLKYPWIYFNEKIDGIRCVVTVENGKVSFVSRTGKPLPEFLTENIEKDLLKDDRYNHLRLDGEIASENFQDLMKVVQRKNVDMNSMMIRNSCRFHIFDIPVPGASLERRVEEIDKLPESTFIKKLKYYKVRPDFALIKEIAKRFIKAGKEGIIIKKPDGVYEDKRSYSWMKFKGKESLDLQIIGTEEGEGKYLGMLGALILDYEGKELRCGSGFTDEDRQDMWSKRDSLPGKICQISFMEKTKTESLRHPVYEAIRVDKNEGDEGDA